MAKLTGRGVKGESWLAVRPLPGEGDRDSTIFEVEFSGGTGCSPTVKRFSIEGWQFQCEPVWVLARIFAHAGSIVDAVVPVDPYSVGSTMEAAVYESGIDWLHAVLFGNPKQNAVVVRFYVQEDECPETFRLVHIKARLEAACKFGTVLEREIIEACPKWWAEFSAPDPGGSE